MEADWVWPKPSAYSLVKALQLSKTELIMKKEEIERDFRATTDDDDRRQEFLAEG